MLAQALGFLLTGFVQKFSSDALFIILSVLGRTIAGIGWQATLTAHSMMISAYYSAFSSYYTALVLGI